MKLYKYFDTLKKIPLFKGFTEEELVLFLNKTNYRICKYTKDSLIFLAKESCNDLNIILDGHLQIQHIGITGKLLIVTEFKAGETIGETLIFGKPNLYPMSIVSTTQVTMLHIPKDEVLYLCQDNHEFLVAFLEFISGKSITLSKRLDQISLKTIRQRIVEFILIEYNKNHHMIIQLNMTKKKWAETMGVQRPSLSRELSILKSEGLIDFDYKYIYIKDLEGLMSDL